MPHNTYPEERVQRTVFHELRHNEDRTAAGDDALEVDDVGVVELPHDACLGEEVEPILVGRARLEGLDGDGP